jgi:hypothetical protein
MMGALRSSEMSVITRITLRNIPDGGILHSHRRENLKSYNRGTIFLQSFPEMIIGRHIRQSSVPISSFPLTLA